MITKELLEQLSRCGGQIELPRTTFVYLRSELQEGDNPHFPNKPRICVFSDLGSTGDVRLHFEGDALFRGDMPAPEIQEKGKVVLNED